MATPTLTFTVQTRYTAEPGGSGVLPLPVQARVAITAATDENSVNVLTNAHHLFHFLWNFGDGDAAAAAEVVVDPVSNLPRKTNSEQYGPMACHTYTAAGAFTITARAFYYDALAGAWMEFAPQTAAIVTTTPEETPDWEVVYVNPASTSSESLGNLASPFKTTAELRTALTNADKLAIYLAVGSELTAPDTNDVLQLQDNRGLRIGKYVPTGTTSAVDPILKLSASASAKSVISFTPSTAANQQSESQRITITGATGGTYRLSFKGEATAVIAYNANAGTIQTELRALSTVGGANLDVTGTGPFDVAFISTLANLNQPLIAVVDENPVTLFPDGTAKVRVTRLQHGSANDDLVDNVVISNVKLDGNSSTGSRGISVTPGGSPGYVQDVTFRDCKIVNTEGRCVDIANTMSGLNGPRGIGFIRTIFEHLDVASAGHTMFLCSIQYAVVMGCGFKGGNGDIAADDHIRVPQFSTTQAQTDMLFRWNGFQTSPEKNYCLALYGGVQRAWVYGNNFTGCRQGFFIDKTTADVVTHPKDVVVEGNSFNNLGKIAGDQSRAFVIRFATNVSIRNNYFYENGYDVTTVLGSDIYIADATGAEESASDTSPIRIEHNSFFRSWGKCGSPHILADDYRYIEHYNNAYHYLGSPSGSSANRAIIRFTDASYSGTAKFKTDGNIYYAPNLIRDGLVKPFVMGASAFVEFDASGTTADWKNNNVVSGSVVHDNNGFYLDPEFRNPQSGNFRFSTGDNLADRSSNTNRRIRFDQRGAVRSGIPDCGAYELDGASEGVAYVYEPSALSSLPVAEGWDYRSGDIRYIELNEALVATGNVNTDVDNRPHHNLAHRDNVLSGLLDGLLTDVNSAFCTPPQSGSVFTAAHKSMQSFINVGHYPDGTLRLNSADLAVLGFLRTDGTNYMQASLNVGDHRVINVSPAEQATDAPQLQQVVLKSGDTMTGVLSFLAGIGSAVDMNQNRLVDLPNAVSAGEPLIFGQAVLKSGDTMTGSLVMGGGSGQAINMSGHKIVQLAAGSGSGDAVRFEQVLLLTGGTMSGSINMGGNLIVMSGGKITSLGAGTTTGDAVRYEQVLLLSGGTMTGVINMNGHNIAMGGGKVTAIGAAVANDDVPQYSQCIRANIEDTKNAVLRFKGHTWDGGSVTYTHPTSAPDASTGFGLNMGAVTDAYLATFDGRYISGNVNQILQTTGNAIYNLAYPTLGHDAANKKYVDDQIAKVTADYFDYSNPIPSSLPMAFTSKKSGKWVVHIYGTLFGADSEDPYDLSVTCNSVTRNIAGGNYPDGNAPWHITMIVTVPDSSGVGTGTLQVTAITSGATIEAVVAHRIHDSTV